MGEGNVAARIIDAGAEISGGVIGAGVGSIMTGLHGLPEALMGGGLGPTIAATIREAARRMLSRREEVRIGGAIRYACEAITERIESGESIRCDGFFDSEDSERSSASEIFEGVVLAAQRSYEERKVPFTGYLMANIAFESKVDRTTANWLIKTIQELTWTQLVLLSAVAQRDALDLPEIQIGKSEPTWSSWGLHTELANLAYGERELILSEKRRKPGIRIPGAKDDLSITSNGFYLRDHVLTNGGQICFAMMSLDRIDRSELSNVIACLRPATESQQRTAGS